MGAVRRVEDARERPATATAATVREGLEAEDDEGGVGVVELGPGFFGEVAISAGNEVEVVGLFRHERYRRVYSSQSTEDLLNVRNNELAKIEIARICRGKWGKEGKRETLEKRYIYDALHVIVFIQKGKGRDVRQLSHTPESSRRCRLQILLSLLYSNGQDLIDPSDKYFLKNDAVECHQ